MSYLSRTISPEPLIIAAKASDDIGTCIPFRMYGDGAEFSSRLPARKCVSIHYGFESGQPRTPKIRSLGNDFSTWQLEHHGLSLHESRAAICPLCEGLRQPWFQLNLLYTWLRLSCLNMTYHPEESRELTLKVLEWSIEALGHLTAAHVYFWHCFLCVQVKHAHTYGRM